MLKIRNEQMDIFRKAALHAYEKDMVTHLYEFSPRHCDVIGEENVQKVIQLGIDRAKTYDFTMRGPLSFYIELMFMFGGFFDTDPQVPWAGEILNDSRILDQMVRADMLHEKMLDYLDKVAGPENIYTLKALQAIRVVVHESIPFSDETFESGILSEMKKIYPQKCEYLGDPPLINIIHKGIETAKTYSMLTMRGTGLFVVLMFAFGHGFAEDPLFPWVSRTLKDPNIPDPEKRAQRLEAKAITYLDGVLNYMGVGK